MKCQSMRQRYNRRNQKDFQYWKDAGRGLFHEIQTDETFTLGELKVEPFKISHDANEPSGYRIGDGKIRCSRNDLGKYDDYTVEHLKNLDAIVLEANHDLKMLRSVHIHIRSNEEWQRQKDIYQNELSGKAVMIYWHMRNLKHVVLGHLSKENNYEELAYETVKLEVTWRDNPYKGDDFPITVAKRSSVSEIIQSVTVL